jgi:7-cyano-7-deazaguanine synthase
MDSIALAYWKRPEIAFTIDYGQAAASTEVSAAAQVCKELDIIHDVIRVDCGPLGSGDMASREPIALAPASEWWPFRNQLLVTLAGMRAVAMGVGSIMLGSVASDDSHTDGRQAFYDAIDHLMLIQEGSIRIEAPALGLSTVELVRQSGIPQTLLAWAHSCHVGRLACGQCRGCVKHYEVTQALYGQPY